MLPEALQEAGKDFSKARSSTLGMIIQMYRIFRFEAQGEDNFRDKFRFDGLESEVIAIEKETTMHPKAHKFPNSGFAWDFFDLEGAANPM